MTSEHISPRRSFASASPEVTLARVSLGLTIYTRDGRGWAQDGALRLFDAFRSRVPEWRMKWFMTSRSAEWMKLEGGGVDELRNSISVRTIDGRVRHLFELSIADVPGACHAGFVYREIDDGRDGMTGYAQVFLPRRADPGELLSLAIEVGHDLPLTMAIGGYVGTYSRPHTREAFLHFEALARRYLALDLQVPWLAARHVRHGLPSIGWLTIIGHELERDLGMDLSRMETDVSGEDVGVMRLSGGTLIRAGGLTMGDVNQMEYPRELARVSQLLDAHLLPDEPRLPGPFAEEGRTEAWRHRFAFPEGWG